MTNHMTNSETQAFRARINRPILDRERMRGHTLTLLMVLGAILLAEAAITGARFLF